MNDRELIVNRDLTLLDEAHYGGRIARTEYRARRRNVLSALRDSHGVTARKALMQPVRPVLRPVPGPLDEEMLPILLGGGARSSRMLLAVFAAGALICAVLLGMFLFAA